MKTINQIKKKEQLLFYTKLETKIEKILNDELSVHDYSAEIHDKIQNLKEEIEKIEEFEETGSTKLYFDTEFTGLRQDATLISIGIIADSGQTFYAEFLDYNHSHIDEWLLNNVMAKLILAPIATNHYWTNRNMRQLECCGDSRFVTSELRAWLSQFEFAEIYSDCLAYDWVLFCNLFGGALSLSIPDNLYYIPFDLSTALALYGIDPDINREEFSSMENASSKHNALWDAQVIKKCFEKLDEL